MFLTSLSLPGRVQSWRRLVGIALLIVLPLGAVLGLAHGPDLADTLSTARTIALCFAALVAAGLVYAHGRVATNEQSEWLGVALGVPAAVTLARTGHALTQPDDLPEHAGDVLALSTLVLGVSALLVAAAVRNPTRLRPLAAALPPLLVALVAQQLLLPARPLLGSGTTPAIAAAHVVASIGLAVLIGGLDALPRWVRRRLGASVALAGAATAVGAAGAGRLPVDALCLLAGLAAALLAVTTALALLRSAVGDDQDELSSLHARLAATEAARRADRARLHEVNTIVAGISSATQLARELPRDEAEELRGLVGAELDRLQRLLERRGRVPVSPSETGGPGGPGGPGEADVDLDEVVGRIAATHRARGHRVSAPPTGCWAAGDADDADDIAEILNILVDNAAAHGSPDDISVLVEEHPDALTIRVSDQGPGVPAALRSRLFDWEQRRPGSPGQGIGLYAADQLARRLGGGLRLEATAVGASFVLRLPHRPERTRVGDSLSHAP